MENECQHLDIPLSLQLGSGAWAALRRLSKNAFSGSPQRMADALSSNSDCPSALDAWSSILGD